MVSRRKFLSDFKSRVALEALREESTLSELSKKYNIHPNQISHWKKQAVDGLKDTFSSSLDKDKVNHEDEVKELHAKICQLTVERDFLVSASKRFIISFFKDDSDKGLYPPSCLLK